MYNGLSQNYCIKPKKEEPIRIQRVTPVNEIFVLIIYAQKPLVNARVAISSMCRGLNIGPSLHPVRIQRGAESGWVQMVMAFPLENHKAVGFLSNTDPDDPDLGKSKKLPSKHSILLGHHRPASETPFEWRFAGGPIMIRF